MLHGGFTLVRCVSLPRHVRALCDDEGYPILTHVERRDLLPGQYLLESARPLPCFDPAISTETRAYMLICNDLTCQMCGAEAGDPDEYDPARRLRLHIDHSIDKTQRAADEPCYLRVLCSLCHEGISGTPLDRSPSLNLLAQVRRATGTAQLDLLAWLVRKFPAQAKRLLEAPDVDPDA